MYADEQIMFCWASNILSREIQMTGAEAVLTASAPYDPDRQSVHGRAQ
jgi:hypothetical protein